MTGVGPPHRLSAAVALAWAAVLLVGDALWAAAPVVGIVRTHDGSAPLHAPWAGWLAVLPALLALAVSARRPVLGALVTAAAGITTTARLVADIGVLAGPTGVVRPELFYEAGPAALPFARSAGLALLVAGNLIAVVAGVMAARLAAGALADEPHTVSGSRVQLTGRLFAGLAGVVCIFGGLLFSGYAGGFLTDRLLPPSIGAWELLGILLVSATALVAVFVADVLPGPHGVAILAGSATTVAVIPAIQLVVAAGTPLSVGGGPWIALAGCAVLVGSGLLGRQPAGRRTDEPAPSDEVAAPLVLRLTQLGLAAAATVLCLAAARLPALLVDGHPDVAADAGPDAAVPLSAPVAAPFWYAGAVLLVVAVLVLVPAARSAGWAAAALVWAAPAYGVLGGLAVYTTVASTLAGSAAGSGLPVHTWSLGPGMWCGVAGGLVAVAAGAAGVVLARRSADASTQVRGDDLLAEGTLLTRSRPVVAVVLAALVLVTGFLPMYHVANAAAPTLGSGLGVDSVALWLLSAVAIAGLAAAAVSDRVGTVAGAGLAAAALLGLRLVIPGSVSGLPGFARGIGYPLVIGVCVVVATGAGVAAVLLNRLPTVDLVEEVRRSTRTAGRRPARPARETR